VEVKNPWYWKCSPGAHFEEGGVTKSHMAPLEKVSPLFAAFLGSYEEFKYFTSVWERVKHIVSKGRQKKKRKKEGLSEVNGINFT